ncbi:MAG: GNAT family N-acetyltransferase [Myxococcota bacterium]
MAKVALNIAVRTATEADAADIVPLWRELMELHAEVDPRFDLTERAEDRFLNYLELARNRDDHRVRVAVEGGCIVGFTVACVLPNSPIYARRWVGYINDLAVHHRCRGRGVGRRLVSDAVVWLRTAGAESIEVYVAMANDDARRFWRKMGAEDYLERVSLKPGVV